VSKKLGPFGSFCGPYGVSWAGITPGFGHLYEERKPPLHNPQYIDLETRCRSGCFTERAARLASQQIPRDWPGNVVFTKKATREKTHAKKRKASHTGAPAARLPGSKFRSASYLRSGPIEQIGYRFLDTHRHRRLSFDGHR
jgi:hypothetical protein